VSTGNRRSSSASDLFTPRSTDRAARKAARQALAEATARARDTAGRDPADSPLAEAEMPTSLYPAGDRPGPASARGGRLKLPAHRMTTAVALSARRRTGTIPALPTSFFPPADSDRSSAHSVRFDTGRVPPLHVIQS
jgi:hypothetical protein